MTTPAPTAPVSAQVPMFGASAAAGMQGATTTVAAPWTATGLTSLGLGGLTTTFDNENTGMAVYTDPSGKTELLPIAQAQAQYQADLAAYQAGQQAKKPQGGPGAKPQLQDYVNSALANDPNISPGGHIPESELAGIQAKAQSQYDTALAAWNQAQQQGNIAALNQTGNPNAPAPGKAPSNPMMADTINQQFSTMNSDQILNLQNRMRAAGILDTKFTAGVADENTVKAFAVLLNETNENLTKDPSSTWTSVLQNAVNQSGWTVNNDGTMTRTSGRNPSLNPLAAQAAFNNALGRNGSPAELAAFQDTYNKLIAGQLVTTDTMDKAGNVITTAPTYAEQSQTVQEAELQAAQQNPDYATYQAATTYWNAMQQALGATGQVENNLK